MATYIILSRLSPEAFRDPKGFKQLAAREKGISTIIHAGSLSRAFCFHLPPYHVHHFQHVTGPFRTTPPRIRNNVLIPFFLTLDTRGFVVCRSNDVGLPFVTRRVLRNRGARRRPGASVLVLTSSQASSIADHSHTECSGISRPVAFVPPRLERRRVRERDLASRRSARRGGTIAGDVASGWEGTVAHRARLAAYQRTGPDGASESEAPRVSPWSLGL